ncbi:MAG: hypothetical protein JO332_01310 [Planctomycetaceae bacterium]|nr:hypothetical protein [Planctomycetaceae bacterium]
MKVVVIVVLIVLLALFAVGVGEGFGKGNHKSSSSSRSKEAEDYQPGGFENALDKVFAPFRPAPDIPEKRILPGQTVSIPASTSPVRTLKLRAKPGCRIEAHYEAAAAPQENVNPIDLRFPRDGKGDRMVNSLPLVKEKGTISRVSCGVSHSCPGLEVLRD